MPRIPFPAPLLRAASALALVFAFCSATAQAAEPLGLYGSRTPAIAFDPTNNRGLAIYEYGGRIYGYTVDAEGRPVPGSQRTIFPEVLSSSYRYRDPSIVFKAPQNRYYIAASRSFRSTVNFPDGAQTYQTADGIELAAFDAGFARVASRHVGTPGQRPIAFVTEGERRPSLAADTFGDASCCIALAWTDARATDQVYVAQFSPSLGDGFRPIQSFPAGATYATDASLTYDRQRDRFAVAYNACNREGIYCAVRMLSVGAVGLDGRRDVALARLANGAPTRPSLVFVPGAGTAAGRYVLAWNWVDGASTGVGVNLVQDSGSALTQAPLLPNVGFVSGGVGAPWFGVFARANPRLVGLGDGRRVALVAIGNTLFSGSNQVFTAFTIDLGTARTTSGQSLSVAAPYIPWGDVAFVPASGRALAVWEHDTIAAGTWTGVFTP